MLNDAISPVLAVIGTAGRQEDGPRLNRALYDAAYAELLRAITDWNIQQLVSGGAAWGDHLAVRAFLEGAVGELVLHLPAPFRNGRFAPTPEIRFDPGRTANRYHDAFRVSTGIDSLAQIVEAVERGAKAPVTLGFFERNAKVAADATHVFAVTFGPMVRPVDFDPRNPGFRSARVAGLGGRGTPHTWEAARGADMKRHVSLTWLASQLVASAG